MKSLKAKPIVEADYLDIQLQLEKLFKKLIFDPIIEILAPHNQQVKKAARSLKNALEVRNAKYDPIVDAINAGRIQYVDDTFSGDFNAVISKALRAYGAKYNRKGATFTIPHEALPGAVTKAVQAKLDFDKKLHEGVLDKITYMVMNLTYNIQENPIDASKTISKMDKKFNEQYGDALQTQDLTPGSKERLKRDYSQSLKPYIKKFSEEQILDLRDIVTENANTGYRFDFLISKIQNKFDVTKSKAEFIARQETALYTARARQARFEDVDIREYVWRTSGDAEVRPDHKKLNGRTFKYSDPPVVDEASGRRGNPAQDYNCRCVDDPVLDKVLEPA